MRIFVGISGASGSIYAGRLLRALEQLGHDATACFSDAAIEVFLSEEGGAAVNDPGGRDAAMELFARRYGLAAAIDDPALPERMGDAFASGSSLAEAAIICPCSMSTLACMASGFTRNLIHRVADVMLKESRPLLLVPRETPLSQIHLRNMLKLSRAGARIIPAMPAFYHDPQTIEDLADFVVGKVLDSLDIRHELFARWKGPA